MPFNGQLYRWNGCKQALKKWGVDKIGTPIYAVPGVRVFEWTLDQSDSWSLHVMNVGLSPMIDRIINDFIKDCLI